MAEKSGIAMLEQTQTRDEEDQKPVRKVDYSGAAEKTDPAEIALVKKLDRWIMPMLWSMYWLSMFIRSLSHGLSNICRLP